MKRIIVVAPKGALDSISPLLAEYQQRFVLTVHDCGSSLPSHGALIELSQNQDALLLIGDRKFAPRTVLPGPFLSRADGEKIPAAWLPYVSDQALFCFAVHAACVHQRQQPKENPVAILGQWNSKFLNLASRTTALLAKVDACKVLHWTSDNIIREDMIQGLSTGLAMGIYMGHGRPIGWVGYRGTRAHHFLESKGKPMGALFSLCCETASRKRNGLSFSESLPLHGVAAATFAAVDKSLHMDNARWATGICHAIKIGKQNVGEVIKAAAPCATSSIDGYRILGDPMAPLTADLLAYELSQNFTRYDANYGKIGMEVKSDGYSIANYTIGNCTARASAINNNTIDDSSIYRSAIKAAI